MSQTITRYIIRHLYTPNNMGVSKNSGTPKTPQNDHFSRKTHGFWVPPFLETPIW